MKVVLAFNAFKESLTAPEVCRAVGKGFRRGCSRARTVEFPVADGGDGTAEAFVAATAGKRIQKTVTGPLGAPVKACYGILGDGRTAIVEMAEASGLALVPPNKRNPLKTTTYGTGELIDDAVRRGVRRIIVGLGGSATVDMATGMAQALGARLLDKRGREIPRGGAGLERLEAIDLSRLRERLKAIEVIAATDVANPLLGKRGGIQVYSPQKGATPKMLERLEAGARHAAGVIRRKLNVDVIPVPGSGAAGGFGAGIIAWLGGTLQSGIEVLLDAANFDKAIKGADLVITGEGQIDNQTAFGKAPAGVAQRAKAVGIPCIALAGGVGGGLAALHKIGITAVFSVCNKPMDLSEAIKDARKLAESGGEQIGRFWKAATSAK